MNGFLVGQKVYIKSYLEQGFNKLGTIRELRLNDVGIQFGEMRRAFLYSNLVPYSPDMKFKRQMKIGDRVKVIATWFTPTDWYGEILGVGVHSVAVFPDCGGGASMFPDELILLDNRQKTFDFGD